MSIGKLFEQVIADIERVNEIDSKSIPEKVFKFDEEFGEFITELGKSIGMTHKPYDEEHFIEEATDSLQVHLSIILKAFKDRNIPFEKVLLAFPEKNKKWETMCKKYTRDQKEQPISENDKNLAFAIENYPVGTKICSLFGAYDVVVEPKNKPFQVYLNEYGDILASCLRETRMIYSDGRWAKIAK